MPATCWVLAYDSCIPGYTSANALPEAVTLNEPRVRAVALHCCLPVLLPALLGRPARLAEAFSVVVSPCSSCLPASLARLQVLSSLYLTTYRSGAFGDPARLPARFSRVCLPDPAAAAKDECKSVSERGRRAWPHPAADAAAPLGGAHASPCNVHARHANQPPPAACLFLS